MDTKLFKSIVNLLVIAAILALVVTRFGFVVNGVLKVFESLKPLLIAVVIAYILRLFQKKIFRGLLQLKKLKITGEIKNEKKFNAVCKGLSILLTYVLLFGVSIALISFIIPQASNSLSMLYDNFDGYKQNMEKALVYFEEKSLDLNLNFEKLRESINSIPDKIGDAFGNIVLGLYNFTFDIIGFIMTLVLGMIMSVYMLAGAENISTAWHGILFTYVREKERKNIVRILNTIDDVFSSFVVGQFFEAMILGGLCFAGMLVFGFEYAPLISTMIGVLGLIPLVGAFMGLFIACFLLFMISPIKAFWFFVFFIVLQQFEGNIIYPKVVGNSIGLPAMLVLMSIVVGGSLFGFMGTVLAVPVTAIIYRLIKEDMQARQTQSS